ncbi:hypothetical protein A9Q93_08900 [Nonlabens dokdonensis]|uniref:Uncharacterized protein n=1 Tax=Nonlabens dokdonensis TaxID=328515 RepID=A0A1Z8AU77_9FLAO|nr:hypothetical protein [Nonlabens dokdonensis]OUS13892.1 hypothetical protein A9Q93_08900 [Nonlabens dokdonensis]
MFQSKTRLLFIILVISCVFQTNGQEMCINGDCFKGLSRMQTDQGMFIGNFLNGQKQGLGITYIDGNNAKYVHYIKGVKQGVEYTFKRISDNRTEKVFQYYDQGKPIYPAVKLEFGAFSGFKVKMSKYGGWESLKNKFDKSGMYTSGNKELYAGRVNEGSVLIAFNNSKAIIPIRINDDQSLYLNKTIDSNSYGYKFNPLYIKWVRDEMTLITGSKESYEDVYFLYIKGGWSLKTPHKGSWEYFSNGEIQDGKLEYKMDYDKLLRQKTPDMPSQKGLNEDLLSEILSNLEDISNNDVDEEFSTFQLKYVLEKKNQWPRFGLDINEYFYLNVASAYLTMNDYNQTITNLQKAEQFNLNSYESLLYTFKIKSFLIEKMSSDFLKNNNSRNINDAKEVISKQITDVISILGRLKNNYKSEYKDIKDLDDKIEFYTNIFSKLN